MAKKPLIPVTSSSGNVFADIGDGGDSRMATLYITLKPPKERNRTSVEFERLADPYGPTGGEAQAIRALEKVISARFG